MFNMELKGQKVEQPVALIHASYFPCVSVEGRCDGAEGVKVTDTSSGTSPEGLPGFPTPSRALSVYFTPLQTKHFLFSLQSWGFNGINI